MASLYQRPSSTTGRSVCESMRSSEVTLPAGLRRSARRTQQLVEPFEEFAYFGRVLQSIARRGLAAAAHLDGDAVVAQRREGVLVGRVVADINRQRGGWAESFANPGDGC